MPDNLVLNGPQGSSFNLGSWLRADPGPDFGEKDLFKTAYAENPISDLPAFSFESVGVRKMAFPLYLPSGGAGLSLAALQGALRLSARPAATLDIQVDGQASAEAIRFDVLGGRLEPDYGVRVWGGGGGRLPAVLKLDTKPLGYMPTTIVLASSASVGLPGSLTIPTSSLLGDVPGLAALLIEASCPTHYGAGTWMVDLLGWSLAGQATGIPFWSGGSLIQGGIIASTVGDKYAPASQALHAFAVSNDFIWDRAAHLPLNAAQTAGLRGRHRVFAYAALAPSTLLPWYMSADVVSADGAHTEALASAASIATLAPQVASGDPGAYGAGASPAFSLVDLGELTLPRVASGPDRDTIRIWTSPATTTPGLSTHVIQLGGLFLLSLDGPNGLMPRGVQYPTTNTALASVNKFVLDSMIGQANLQRAGASQAIIGIRQLYFGEMPKVGASVTRLDLLGGARKASAPATGPVVQSAPFVAKAAVLYRPRFAFIKGL